MRPPLPLRRTDPAETPGETTFLDTEAALLAGLETIRARESDPAERQKQSIRFLEQNADVLAAQDARRALLVLPPDRARLPVPAPRPARPGETEDGSELRRLENRIESEIAALRSTAADADPATRSALRAAFLERHRELLSRRDELLKKMTRTALDTPAPTATP